MDNFVRAFPFEKMYLCTSDNFAFSSPIVIYWRKCVKDEEAPSKEANLKEKDGKDCQQKIRRIVRDHEFQMEKCKDHILYIIS
ncbi:hypothetical protein RCL_jg13898.t1 [Rhizophagus clarus]|uniref:Uncharacterized protein n=1 Tax=Rhizophagus clarus TaxID=94130 RepID=A0A8H3QWA8_9GLOM|nr:hypothetical protein RCL_jg13898.t1 [Rhizophagus clarus]